MAAVLEMSGAVWLVTPMLADANAGLFGAPRTFPTKNLKAILCDVGQLSRETVDAWKYRDDLSLSPVLVYESADSSIHHVFDGLHRLCALQELGLKRFMAWSVPRDKIWNYRVPQEVLVASVASILRSQSTPGRT